MLCSAVRREKPAAILRVGRNSPTKGALRRSLLEMVNNDSDLCGDFSNLSADELLEMLDCNLVRHWGPLPDHVWMMPE